MSNEVRVESRIRNNRLWKETIGKYGSIRKFCEVCWGEYSKQVIVGKFLNLKQSPYSKKYGNLLSDAVDIVSFTGVLEDQLFPPKLYNYDGLTLKVQEVSINRLDEIEDKAVSYQIEDVLDRMHGNEIVDLVKSRIYSSEKKDKERCFQVLNYRFGLEEVSPLTLSEVGKLFGICPNRVRQIEAETLKLLRYGDDTYQRKIDEIREVNYGSSKVK